MFILVEVIERGISIGNSNTLEEAQELMKKRFDSYNGSELAECGSADIGARFAWINSGEFSDNPNCDWEIFEVKGD